MSSYFRISRNKYLHVLLKNEINKNSHILRFLFLRSLQNVCPYKLRVVASIVYNNIYLSVFAQKPVETLVNEIQYCFVELEAKCD